MEDCLGQEIKVGSIVMEGSGGNSGMEMGVVTKLATVQVQVNCRYIPAASVMVIDGILSTLDQKYQDKALKLTNQYKQYFDYKSAKNKRPEKYSILYSKELNILLPVMEHSLTGLRRKVREILKEIHKQLGTKDSYYRWRASQEFCYLHTSFKSSYNDKPTYKTFVAELGLLEEAKEGRILPYAGSTVEAYVNSKGW